MSKNLVLVESPSKAKTINKYLGKDYHVEATVGHIRNLPKTKLGVDIEHGFKPEFLNIRGKGDIIKKIKTLASKSSNIFIATDPDREGEAIAQDIADVIEKNNTANVYRVLFNEITKNAVTKAIKSPIRINTNLVSSQRARRVMDRIIGYQISPLLWKAVIDPSNNALSAGRVQSVALRLICEREAEIEGFIPVEYWSLIAVFSTQKGETFSARLAEVDGKSLRIQPKPVMSDDDWREFLKSNFAINNEETALDLFTRVKKKSDFVIDEINKREQKRNPQPPFITSSLQQEASRRLRYKASQTMSLAQALYEGIDLGKEGTVGLITYMRTDSTRIGPEITAELRDYIKSSYGEKYLPESPRTYEKKGTSNVQDAHEAIRPTSMHYTPEFVKPFLDPKQYKLYELIWKRFVASQMNPAVLEVTTVEVRADEFLFKATGSAIKFDGFLQVYEEQTEDQPSGEDAESGNIPVGLEKGQHLRLEDLLKNQHFTKPPARYTESSLIKELESLGIGRPSTYALIVGTIQERKYVQVDDRRLRPTELGKKVNDILVKSFPEILNVHFTAQMENELDLIAQGENNYLHVLNDFYGPFSSALKNVEKHVEKVYCDQCGNEMVIKMGRFGKFLACSNYPDCKNIKSLKDVAQESKPAEPEYTGETCEKCGARTIYRKGRFGKFIGCERYPECDFIKSISLGVKCPKCKQGDIVEKQSRRGKAFYGCSRYPDCDFVAWYKPVPQECPNHDSKYMEKRYSTKKGEFLRCPVCGEEKLMAEQGEEVS